MTEYVNPETVARYKEAFNRYAKNGGLPVLSIVECLEEAKEDFTEDDVFDALEVMGIKNEPLKLEQFTDIIGIMIIIEDYVHKITIVVEVLIIGI